MARIVIVRIDRALARPRWQGARTFCARAVGSIYVLEANETVVVRAWSSRDSGEVVDLESAWNRAVGLTDGNGSCESERDSSKKSEGDEHIDAAGEPTRTRD